MKLKDLKKVYIPQGPAGFSTFIAAAALALCEIFFLLSCCFTVLILLEGIVGRRGGDEAAGGKEWLSSLTPQLLGGCSFTDVCSALGAASMDRQNVTLPWKCGRTEPWTGNPVKLDINSLWPCTCPPGPSSADQSGMTRSAWQTSEPSRAWQVW